MKIVYLLIFIIFSINLVSADTLLSEQNQINSLIYPISVDKYCGNSYYSSLCLIFSPTTDEKHGQYIKIPSGTGTITFLKILVSTEIGNSSQLLSNFTINVYTDEDNDITSKTLEDSFYVAETSIGNHYINLEFDNPIIIQDSNGISRWKYLFIEIKENWAKTYYWDSSLYCTPCYSNFINVNFYAVYISTTNNDVYSDSDLQVYDNTNSWYYFPDVFNDIYNVDIYFKMYGSWYIPQTPLNTPDVTPIDTSDPLPCYDCNGSLPQLSPNETYLPNFSIIPTPDPNSTACPDCLPSSTSIPADIIKKSGYCKESGCTMDDVWMILYDITNPVLWLSFLALAYKIWRIRGN